MVAVTILQEGYFIQDIQHFNNLWGVHLCQSANKRDGNNIPKQETSDGQRLHTGTKDA